MAWWDSFLGLLARSQQRLTPFPLSFLPNPVDVRTWPAEVTPAGTTLPVPLPGSNVSVHLHRLLIEAGIALTPAATAWDPRAWFALFRYGPSLAGTGPKLRLFAGSQHLDPRITTVLAEEMAAGITCYILREHFELDHIADVYPLLAKGDLAFVSADEVRPDFFCLDRFQRCVLAESKGAVGTRSAIEQRVMVKGRAQVMNVAPTRHTLRPSCNRVVIGTHICIEDIHQRSETTTLIDDPEGEELPVGEPSDFAMRAAYAKSLRFAGRDLIADFLMLGQSPPPLSFQTAVVSGQELAILGLAPFGGLVCLLPDVLNAIVNASVTPLTESIPPALEGWRARRFELTGGYGFPDGLFIVYSDGFEHLMPA